MINNNFNPARQQTFIFPNPLLSFNQNSSLNFIQTFNSQNNNSVIQDHQTINTIKSQNSLSYPYIRNTIISKASNPVISFSQQQQILQQQIRKIPDSQIFISSQPSLVTNNRIPQNILQSIVIPQQNHQFSNNPVNQRSVVQYQVGGNQQPAVGREKRNSELSIDRDLKEQGPSVGSAEFKALKGSVALIEQKVNGIVKSQTEQAQIQAEQAKSLAQLSKSLAELSQMQTTQEQRQIALEQRQTAQEQKQDLQHQQIMQLLENLNLKQQSQH